MSEVGPPYTYVDMTDNQLLGWPPNTLAYLYASEQFGVVYGGGNDLFQSGCAYARPDDPAAALHHPVGSYNISYPYCRTAFRFRMDEPRANPQLGQIVVATPFVSIKIILDGCDQSRVVGFTSKLDPAQPLGPCTVALFPSYTLNEFLLIVEAAALTMPVRFTFTATNAAGVVRTFWIGMRDRRDGVPSGALV